MSGNEAVAPTRWRRKPVVVEAMRLDGTIESGDAILRWIEANGGEASYGFRDVDGWDMDIVTPGVVMTASPGDWIVMDAPGGCWVVDPDAFAAIYESANVWAGDADKIEETWDACVKARTVADNAYAVWYEALGKWGDARRAGLPKVEAIFEAGERKERWRVAEEALAAAKEAHMAAVGVTRWEDALALRGLPPTAERGETP